MIKSKRVFLVTLFASVLITFAAFTVYGQENFRGNTIRFIVGDSPGGVFETYTRLIARHFGKHVPGNPTVVVENMTGAGGNLGGQSHFTIELNLMG